MFLLLVLYALFASTFIMGREVVSLVPPIFFIGIRMILSGFLLMGFVKLYDRPSFKFARKDLWWMVGIVLFHIYGAYVLEFISLQYLTGASVALLYNLLPFLTALFSYWLFQERLSFKKWIGLGLGFLAFLPLIVTNPAPSEATPYSLYAHILLFLAVVSSCIGWIFMKQLISKHSHSYVFVNGVGMLLGGLLSLGTSYFYEPWPLLSSLPSNAPFMRLLFLLILVGNVICYNLYGKLLHRYSATTLSFFGCTTPLFAALFGWLWLGETVSPWFYVTVLLVTIALYIFYQEELKEGILNHRG